MSQLYRKMYTTLFNRVEDVLACIERKMWIPQSEDWMYTREVRLKLQAALQECEDIYVGAEEGEE